jgi:hypothetical protein
LTSTHGPMDDGSEAMIDVALDDLVEIIVAAVVIDEEVLNAEGEVVREPFLEIGPFVANDDDHAQLEAGRGHERALPDDVGRRRPLRLSRLRLRWHGRTPRCPKAP